MTFTVRQGPSGDRVTSPLSPLESGSNHYEEAGTMSVYSNPQDHAANPPETWVVVKVADRKWQLQDAQGTRLHYGTTKRECEYAREVGFIRNLYDDETRWYAGESVRGWKPYAQLLEERAELDAAREAKGMAS